MNYESMSTEALCTRIADLRGLIVLFYQGGTMGDAHVEYSRQLGEVQAELRKRFPTSGIQSIHID